MLLSYQAVVLHIFSISLTSRRHGGTLGLPWRVLVPTGEVQMQYSPSDL